MAQPNDAPPRVMLVTRRVTYTERRLAGTVTPDYAFTGGLPGLLGRVAAKMTGGGVLLLDDGACTALGLPTEDVPYDQRAEHPVTVACKAAGWQFYGKGIGRWFKVWAPNRPTLHVCLLPLVDDRERMLPALGSWPHQTTSALAAWHQLAGVPWYGSPGMAGNDILKALHGVPQRGAKKPDEPAWKLTVTKQGKTITYAPDDDPLEWAYTGDDWRHPDCATPTWRYEHGFDRVRAYLAAMACAEVARFQLQHTGRMGGEYDPTRAGWWLVELSPWGLAYMPDPAGYGRKIKTAAGVERHWLSTPRLDLLTQLVKLGVHGGFEVVDSWTSVADRKIMQKYANRLSEVWEKIPTEVDPEDQDRVYAMTQQCYKQAYGIWRSPDSMIQRSDWSGTVLAVSACNTWRDAWGAGGGVDGAGPWPLRINNDTLWYASDSPDPAEAVPQRTRPSGRPWIDLAERLGGYRAKYLIDRKEAA